MDAVRLAQLLRQMPEDNPKGYDEAGYVAKYGVPAPYNSLQDYQDVTGRHLNDEFKMPNNIKGKTLKLEVLPTFEFPESLIERYRKSN